jgi:thioredoxin 1
MFKIRISFFSFMLLAIVFLNGCATNNQKSEAAEEEKIEKGIKFFNGSFKETLQKAKSENKLVFIDAYTTWCGPCKMMKQGTFPDALVGKIFNEKFVSIAVDMEAGEGIEMSQKFAVQGYPTLLFLDSDGKVIQNALGYRDPAGLIALANDITKK